MNVTLRRSFLFFFYNLTMRIDNGRFTQLDLILKVVYSASR